MTNAITLLVQGTTTGQRWGYLSQLCTLIFLVHLQCIVMHYILQSLVCLATSITTQVQGVVVSDSSSSAESDIALLA